MKSILIIFLMMHAGVLNAGKTLSKQPKKLNTITISDTEDDAEITKMIYLLEKMSVSGDSQLRAVDNATNKKMPDFKKDNPFQELIVPLEVFDYIMNFLPGNHPFIIDLAYNENYRLSSHLAGNIVKSFKKTCVKVLRNHEQAEEPSCKYGKAKIDYGATIFQSKAFIDKKRRFLFNLRSFLAQCPEKNRAVIDSILQKNIQKLYEIPRLTLPVDHFELIHIGMSPENIKNIYEKAVLVAIAKSCDKISATPTIIYQFYFKCGENKEVLFLQKLLPSINWYLSMNGKSVDMPKNSPYRKYPEARGCKDVIFL